MDLKGDPLAVDLAGSAATRPYMNYYEAVVRNDHQATEGGDPTDKAFAARTALYLAHYVGFEVGPL
jgi:hypothetical protein